MRTRVILLALLFTSLLSFVSAADIGVSPAKILFSDVLRGGYSERPVTITLNNDEPVEVALSARGEIGDWIELSEDTFEISSLEAKRLTVAVVPPVDTPNGVYSGFIRIQGSPLGNVIENEATSVVVPVLDLFVEVEVTDQEFVQCDAKDFVVASAEEDEEIIVSMSILNEGNVRLRPRVQFDIWDQDLVINHYSEELLGSEIIPSQRNTVVFRIPSSGLELGQYWMDISTIDCFNTQTLTFDILEEGALRAKGELESILVQTWVTVDEIVPIRILFTNSGEKALDARFSGEVSYNGEVIRILESEDSSFVPLEGSAEFLFYFTPRSPGKYIVSGRVFYDGKRTFEKSSVFNAQSDATILGLLGKLLLYILLLLVISFLIYKVRRERKLYELKVRRISQ